MSDVVTDSEHGQQSPTNNGTYTPKDDDGQVPAACVPIEGDIIHRSLWYVDLPLQDLSFIVGKLLKRVRSLFFDARLFALRNASVDIFRAEAPATMLPAGRSFLRFSCPRNTLPQCREVILAFLFPKHCEVFVESLNEDLQSYDLSEPGMFCITLIAHRRITRP